MNFLEEENEKDLPLTSKYDLTKYGADQRQQIVAENNEDAAGPNWLAGIAALGSAIGGGGASGAINAGQTILNQQNARRSERLKQFDDARDTQIKQINTDRDLQKFEKERAIEMRDADPNSPESKMAQDLAKEMGFKGDVSNLTAEKFKTYSPALQKKYEIEQKRIENSLKREELGQKRESALDEKQQRLVTPYGLANTEADAKDLKAAYESKKSFDAKLSEMADLREKHNGGALFNREDVARGKQLSKDLLLEYKNMAKLGVLSQADEAIINAIIPADPLEYNSPIAALQGQDPILHKLRKFQSDKDKDFETKIQTRIRKGQRTEVAQSDQVSTSKSAPKKVAHMPGDVVKIKGKSYRVGADGDSLEEAN